MLYILKNRMPIAVSDSFEWSQWMEQNDVKLDLTELVNNERIITYFLGTEKLNSIAIECFFETKVIGGLFDGWSFLYQDYDEALKGHQKVVHDVGCLESGVA